MVEADWKEGARAAYLSKRAELTKKVTAAEKAERKAGERVNSLNRQLEDLEAGARAFGLDDLSQSAEEIVVEAIAMRDGTQASAKEIILNALAERSPMKAKELKAVIEAKIGREVHYKTPGMTLYRLAEDGLVRRDFHDWSITDKGKLTRAQWIMDDRPADGGIPQASPFDIIEPDDPLDDPLDEPFEPDDPLEPDDPPDYSEEPAEEDDEPPPF